MTFSFAPILFPTRSVPSTRPHGVNVTSGTRLKRVSNRSVHPLSCNRMIFEDFSWRGSVNVPSSPLRARIRLPTIGDDRPPSISCRSGLGITNSTPAAGEPSGERTKPETVGPPFSNVTGDHFGFRFDALLFGFVIP